METKNPSLERLLASVSKIQKENEAKDKQKNEELINKLPAIQKEIKEQPINEVSLIPMTDLSLNPDEPITRDVIMSNVKVQPRQLKGDIDKINKARRSVGRLTTGASAAVPLTCYGEKCPFSKRCVHEDTLVYTVKGEVQIKNLRQNDIIYSINSEGYLEKDIVLEVINVGEKQTYTITTEFGLSLQCTDDHPILSYDNVLNERVYKSIKEGLKVNDNVYVLDVNFDLPVNTDTVDYGDLFEDRIIKIKPYKTVTVYDITVKNNSNFIANGLAVHNCPYYKENLHILNENCIMEEQLVEYWTQKYIDELDIDMRSISEMHWVSRLVEISILDIRMTNYMAINDQDLMMDFISSVDPNGAAITNKGISVAFEVKERLEKQKLKILESLNQTRDKKAKIYLQSEDKKNTQSTKALFDKLDKLAERIDLKNNIIDVG